MKMPKLPKIAFRSPPEASARHATARRAPAADDYYDEEPKTNLSSAFVVVLILHVVAVGGIYAFNSIKAARRGSEPRISATARQFERRAPGSQSLPRLYRMALNTAATATPRKTARRPPPLRPPAPMFTPSKPATI